MKIDEVMAELRRVRKDHGNIEVTCTGSTLCDSDGPLYKSGVFETTVENIIVNTQHPKHGKAARLWL